MKEKNDDIRTKCGEYCYQSKTWGICRRHYKFNMIYCRRCNEYLEKSSRYDKWVKEHIDEMVTGE